MDTLRINQYKIQAINKHKKQQFVNNILLYSLTTLACTLFCSSPLWYPPFCATFNVFFFSSLPKIISLFFTTKVLFIVGNLIVIFLVGESKILASEDTGTSPSTDTHYRGYKRDITPGNQSFSSFDKKQGEKISKNSGFGQDFKDKPTSEVEEEKEDDIDEDEDLSLPAQELNKLADDFIAKVNRQRKFEAVFDRD